MTWSHVSTAEECCFNIPLPHDAAYALSGIGNSVEILFSSEYYAALCTKYGFLGFPHPHLPVGSCIFAYSRYVGPSSCVIDSVEIHDSGRRPPNEESPLQADSGPEHSLRGPQENPLDWDPAAK